MRYITKKGSILVAFILITVLVLTTAAFLTMLGGRSTLTGKQLKRAQAFYCAEAALYEAFNRVRANQIDPSTSPNITVNVPVTPPGGREDGTDDYDVPVNVAFSGNSAPYKVEARVNYSAIEM